MYEFHICMCGKPTTLNIDYWSFHSRIPIQTNSMMDCHWQVMYSLQCSNPLYGTTENPHKRGREAGGSSGGEVGIFWNPRLVFTMLVWHNLTIYDPLNLGLLVLMFCLGSTGRRGRLHTGTRLWHWWKVTHYLPHVNDMMSFVNFVCFPVSCFIGYYLTLTWNN